MLNLYRLNPIVSGKVSLKASLIYAASTVLPLSLAISAGAIGLLCQADQPSTPLDQALNLSPVDQAHPIAQLSENLSPESLEQSATPVVIPKPTVFDQASLYLRQGEQAQAADQPEVALAEYAKAIDIAKAEGHRSFESVLWHRVGQTYAAARDYKRAETYYQQAIDLAQSTHNPYVLAIAQADLGHIYEKQGKLQQALTQYRQALPQLQAIGDRQGTAGIAKQQQSIEVALNQPANKPAPKLPKKLPNRTIATTGIAAPETALVKEHHNASKKSLQEI